MQDLEKHSSERWNFWNIEQREAHRVWDKTANARHNIGRSFDPNAKAAHITMQLHHENRKMQEKTRASGGIFGTLSDARHKRAKSRTLHPIVRWRANGAQRVRREGEVAADAGFKEMPRREGVG